MVDAVGTNKYTYTIAGRLFTEDGPWASDTVTNFYNNGLRTNLSLAQPTGSWTNGFGYDAAKRLTSVTSPAGAFGYTYVTAASRLTQKLALPNTSYITNAYDNMARMRFTRLNNSGNTTLDKAEYGYNAGNQRHTMTNSVNWSTNRYDNIGQLTVVDNSTAAEDRGYKYDTAWNLNYRTNNGTLETFTVDGKNQLASSPESAWFNYDDNGNPVAKDASADYFYAFDAENRLIGIEFAYGYMLSFSYDGLGRLRSKSTWAWSWEIEDYFHLGSLNYIYDGMRVVQERWDDNTVRVSYTRGTDLSGSLEGAGGIGGLLACTYNWMNLGNYFYHADGNGNVTYLVKSNQTLGASYRYDAYGNTLASSGSMAGINTYRFSSKEIEAESGLYYYGYRWYAPSLQRWLNRDPIEENGGFNLYGFVKNNPVDFADTLGLAVNGPPPCAPFPGCRPPSPGGPSFPQVPRFPIITPNPMPGPGPIVNPKPPIPVPRPIPGPWLALCIIFTPTTLGNQDPPPPDCKLARSTPDRCYYLCDFGDGKSTTIWVPNPTGGQCPETPPRFPGPNTPSPQPLPVPR